MRAYPTRKDQITEKVDTFLADKSKETMNLRMYSREIKYVSQDYSGKIIVEKNGHYKDTALWECTIHKL